MAYPFLRLWLFPLVKAIFIKKISGLENLPKKGPYIIVANHESYIDPVLLTVAVVPKINKKIIFIAWYRIFKWWSDIFLRFWFGSIPEHGAVAKAIEVLKKGKVVGIFPEGGRTRNGRMQKVTHTGTAVAAILANVQIVPVSMRGTYEIWSRYRRFPKLDKSVEIKVGKPIRLRYKKLPSRAAMLRDLNKMMKQIDKTKRS